MAAPVRVGDVLSEKYEVTKILGTGGMGVVVAAHHRELDKLVALKFMHEELSANGQAVDRFLREARAAARLKDEHVGQVLDVGRLPGGIPFIVMEYLEGQDLGQVLERQGPLPVSDAVEYVLQVCEAMAEAHVLGIIHRDLKPQNLFLTTRQDGRRLVKVLDFGISKAQFVGGATSTSQQMGSPGYMAPEQIKSARLVDARADIWSLGVILYQLLSNTLPFTGDTIPEVMFKALSEPPPPLATVRPGIPARLLQAIDRCLEKDRDRRFSNVAELAQELVPFAPERGRAALSIIEHVVSAVHDPRGTTRELDVPAPDGSCAVASAQTSRPELPAATSTTLGSAASSPSAANSRGSRRRLTVTAIVAVAMIAAVVVAAWERAGTSVSSPNRGLTDAPSAPADAMSTDLALGDASVAPHDAEAREALGSPPSDAAAAVDALPRRRPHRGPGTPPPPDAPSLEPAREDPILIPARQP